MITVISDVAIVRVRYLIWEKKSRVNSNVLVHSFTKMINGSVFGICSRVFKKTWPVGAHNTSFMIRNENYLRNNYMSKLVAKGKED